MQLRWFDLEHTTVVVTLDAGETLGNFTGPNVVTVPAVAGNKEYDLIIASGEPIGPAPKTPRRRRE